MKTHLDREGYPRVTLRRDGQSTKLRVHRIQAETFIGPAEGMFVDHINGNRQDNRLSNLRYCSASENARNRRKNKKNRTGYKGVTPHKATGKYEVRIRDGSGKCLYLGLFECPKAGALAYNEAAIEHHGEFAHLNEVA